MEKSFDLSPLELETFAGLEQENLRANATYGILARQMDEAKMRIAQTEEAQRNFIRTALRDRGVLQFERARLEPGRVVAEFNEAAINMVRSNGAIAAAAPIPTE